jgi:hypothetical protein
VKLPEKETYMGDLTAYQIVEKINTFQLRLKRESYLEVAPFAESYFIDLVALYPVSMCSKTMTDNLKLVAALFFLGSKPTNEPPKPAEEDLKAKELFPRNKPSPIHRGYSYDDLALIFGRTRHDMVEAVRQKGEEAKVMLEEAKLRCESQKAAFEELTDEEKRVLAAKKIEEKNGVTRRSLPC